MKSLAQIALVVFALSLHFACKAPGSKPMQDKVVLVPKSANSNVDTLAIVPVIKSAQWLENNKSQNLVYQEYCDDLYVVFGKDSEHGILFYNPQDLSSLQWSESELLAQAVRNLRRLIPPIHIRGDQSPYAITAGGTYESSIILFQGFWDSLKVPIQGDVVIAIPARDILMVTSSQDEAGVAFLKKNMDMLYQEAPHALSDQIYIRKNGRFEVMD